MENKLKEILQKQAWCNPALSNILDSFRSLLSVDLYIIDDIHLLKTE